MTRGYYRVTIERIADPAEKDPDGFLVRYDAADFVLAFVDAFTAAGFPRPAGSMAEIINELNDRDAFTDERGGAVDEDLTNAVDDMCDAAQRIDKAWAAMDQSLQQTAESMVRGAGGSAQFLRQVKEALPGGPPK